MSSRRPAQFDMPKPKEWDKLAAKYEREANQPAPLAQDDGWWDAVLNDPRAAGRPWLPIEQCRLSEVPRHVFRVECLKCFRTVEITKLDAIRLWGPHAVLKELAEPLLQPGCTANTGSRDDGCWPNWVK